MSLSSGIDHFFRDTHATSISYSPMQTCISISAHPLVHILRRWRFIFALVVPAITASCGHLQPDGADWHRTRKVSVEVCLPTDDQTVRAIVALHRHVSPDLLHAGVASVLGGDPYPARKKTMAGEPVFINFWEAPSNSHRLITVQIHGRDSVGPVWNFQVLGPSEYQLEWSDWVFPMDIPLTHVDVPRVRYRLEYPREHGTDATPIPACS